MTPGGLILLVSAYLVFAGNYTFFSKVLEVYPPVGMNLFYFATMALLLFVINGTFFLLLGTRRTIKPLMIFVLLVSSLVSYFMNTYQVMIDRGMIRSVLETDIHEALGLFNAKLLAYFVFLGLLPSWFVFSVTILERPLAKELVSRLKILSGFLFVTVVIALSSGGFYASFFREHRPLKNYTNPYYWIKSSISFVKHSLRKYGDSGTIRPIGTDAKILREKSAKPKLVIFVIGEATRWDHLGVNGYGRDTTPHLGKRSDVISFSDFYSCGTYTAHSVPCMFSVYDRKHFNREKADRTENLMDVLAHTGRIDLLWLENNSDPKGVMKRLGYTDYRFPENNPVCDDECRDEGMLRNLAPFIDANASRDKLIVFHQMGSHGPEYYKRYTKRHMKYTPVCRSNLLEKCTKEEVVNAYDNTIVHTDAFLDETIRLLEKYRDRYQVAMIYIADHGESLGEHGIFLHGIPYLIAPEAQKHVGALMWFGDGFAGIDMKKLREKAHSRRYSHDNIFSTFLGIFDVNTSLYQKSMDILAPMN